MEVKPEIKVDADSPSKLAELDEFEDDTDLYIPQSSNGAWLLKVPEAMWKAWNQMYKDTPEGQDIEVGKMRVYHAKDNEDPLLQRIELNLHDKFEQHKAIPKLWQLELKTNGYNNTVVFSEKDLPGHRAQQFGSNRGLGASKPSGIPIKSERYGMQRRPGGYRTTIPKQTALAPPIYNEAIAKPVEDDSSLVFFKKQYDNAMNAGKKVTYTNRIDKGRNHPGTASTFTFGSITSRPGRGNRKKQPKEKAVRISKEEMLDRLQQCFQKYTYWSLKTLRAELRQPEAWIKEVLEEIAVLVRSGVSFAGTYKLNENTARLLNMQNAQLKEEAAPVKNENESDGGTDDELGDGDDDDVDFEDVDMASST